MADNGLFIGWGAPRVGKELGAAKVFEEAIAYYNQLMAAGEIESFEPVVLQSHGGDLGGFFLLRGEAEKLARVRMTPEFERLSLRASACLDGIGIVGGFVGEGVMRSMERWQEAIKDLV